MSDQLSVLPIDVLIDALLPAIPTRDLISLSRTCRRWHTFLTSQNEDCEILWKRRTIAEFNFPAGASGRRVGWFSLFSRLARSAAFVWGQNENGRLALPDATAQLPTSLRSRLLEGGLVLPTRLELPAPPVSIVAGGWSFHALTADGKVVSWGTLNGNNWARDGAPLHDDGRALRPSVLPQSDTIGTVMQLEAGRSHTTMLSRGGRVWEMRSFGRVVEIEDMAQRWGPQAQDRVFSIHAGWDYSAVLTASGAVYVWWEPAPAVIERGAKNAGEDSLTTPSSQGVAFSVSLDTLQLPPLPQDTRIEDDKIKLIACGDNFVLALTEQARLYYLDLTAAADPQHPHAGQGAPEDPEDSPARSRPSIARLEAEFLSGRRSWRYMKLFCDVDHLAKSDDHTNLPLSSGTRITHISAHFNSFAAYCVPSTSDALGSFVLLGDSDWHEQARPQVIEELQGLGVIKIAQGDYHNLALTSSGHLYAWGAYSAGALGLGHPVLSNTPLSAPPAPLPPRPLEPNAGSPSMPRINNPNRPSPATTRQPHPIFPGFAPARPAADRPRAPQRVEKPTRIRFDSDPRADGDGGDRTFVYAVTASGWHSGALAVDISPEIHEEDREKEAEARKEPIILLKQSGQRDNAQGPSESAHGGHGTGPAHGAWMGRLGGPFRIGYAGRGAHIGGAGGGVRPPSR